MIVKRKRLILPEGERKARVGRQINKLALGLQRRGFELSWHIDKTDEGPLLYVIGRPKPEILIRFRDAINAPTVNNTLEASPVPVDAYETPADAFAHAVQALHDLLDGVGF